MPEFEWDEANVGHLYRRHRIRAEEAESVLDDPARVHRFDDSDVDEERTIVIGHTFAGRLLRVVYTMHGERVRVVTAFPADQRDEREYWGVK